MEDSAAAVQCGPPRRGSFSGLQSASRKGRTTCTAERSLASADPRVPLSDYTQRALVNVLTTFVRSDS